MNTIQINENACLDGKAVKCKACEAPLSIRERQKCVELCECCSWDFYQENVVKPALEAEGPFVYYGYDNDDNTITNVNLIQWRYFHCPTCRKAKWVMEWKFFLERSECNACITEIPF